MPVRRKKAVERIGGSTLNPFYVKLSGAGVVVLMLAFFIGTSDSGQINIANTISSINQERIETGGDPADNISAPGEAYRNLPNGGLVPADPSAVPPPPPPPAEEETASTTPEGETSGDESGEVPVPNDAPSEAADSE